MARPHTLKKQISLYVSEEMYRLLEQVADRNQKRVNDTLREGIRYFLDNQAEVIGSKRHFQRSLQERLDTLEGHLLSQMLNQQQLHSFYEQVLIHLVSITAAAQLSRLSNMAIQPAQLLERAFAAAQGQREALTFQLQTLYESGAR